VAEIRALVIKARDSDATLAANHEAFGELVRCFQDMAYVCAYAILGDFQLAEDAAQESFISAWQKLPQLREPDAFPGWFRRIVLTECNRLTRGKHLRFASLDEGVELSSVLDHPQTALEQNELKNTVFTAIEKLPENERLVVVLFYLEEHSQRDISAFLEVPMTTVAKRLYSARVRLRGMMTKESKEDFLAHLPSRNRTFAEKVAAGIFDEYIGEYRYELRPELTVVIKREGNKLIAESAGQRNELFTENDSERELMTKEFDGRGRVVRDDEGHITHFIYYEFGQEMGVAKKIS
jgi:RNA polymerase sigma factor (sigma-70 family)